MDSHLVENQEMLQNGDTLSEENLSNNLSSGDVPNFINHNNSSTTNEIMHNHVEQKDSTLEENFQGYYEQRGPVIAGPGALRNPASLLGVGLGKLSSSEKRMLEKAQKYAMEQSVKEVIRKQNLAHQQQQQKAAQRQQALILMCKLYVGSICFELGEDAIRTAFEPFGTITRIDLTIDPVLRRHRGFAFVEYDLPEGAYLALEQMNGAMLAGRPLKVVSRPSNLPQSQPIVDEIIEESKRYNRIYVASVKPEISEADVKSVFEVFGTIRSCEMVRSGIRGQHKGYGFIEYETAKAAQDAIAAMNMFDLAGKHLRVGRAITPPNAFLAPSVPAPIPKAVTMAAAAATARIQAIEAVSSNVQALTGAIAPIAPAVAPGYVSPNRVMSPVYPQSPSPVIPPVVVGPGTVPLVTGTVPLVTGTVPIVTTPQVVPKVVLPPPQVANIVLPASPTTVAPPVIQPPTTTAIVSPVIPAALGEDVQKKQQQELEKKLLEEQEPQTLQQEETMMIKGSKARYNLMQKLMKESRVVLLKNAFGPEDIDDDLKEEVTEECENYGKVENVIIYQEHQSQDENSEVIVKIFVEFSNSDEARKAKDALNGRYFGGRVVKAELYDQALYEANYFSG